MTTYPLLRQSFTPDLSDGSFMRTVDKVFSKLKDHTDTRYVCLKYRVSRNIYEDAVSRFIAAYSIRGEKDSLYFVNDLTTEVPMLKTLLQKTNVRKFTFLHSEETSIQYADMQRDLERMIQGVEVLEIELKYLKQENLLLSMNSNTSSVQRAVSLQRLIDDAVSKEHYEQAATYRDDLLALNLNTI